MYVKGRWTKSRTCEFDRVDFNKIASLRHFTSVFHNMCGSWQLNLMLCSQIKRNSSACLLTFDVKAQHLNLNINIYVSFLFYLLVFIWMKMFILCWFDVSLLQFLLFKHIVKKSHCLSSRMIIVCFIHNSFFSLQSPVVFYLNVSYCQCYAHHIIWLTQ